MWVRAACSPRLTGRPCRPSGPGPQVRTLLHSSAQLAAQAPHSAPAPGSGAAAAREGRQAPQALFSIVTGDFNSTAGSPIYQ